MAFLGSCDASGIAQPDLSNSHRFEEQGNHWTPDGHAAVASRIHDFLVERDFLGRRPALQARPQASTGATRLPASRTNIVPGAGRAQFRLPVGTRCPPGP